MIKLTAPNGEPVWLSPPFERLRWVSEKARDIAQNHNMTSITNIGLLSGEMQIVQETPEQIIKKLQ